MALIAAVLAEEIRKFSDVNHPEFSGFPSNALETATKWARALKAYFATLGPPVLIPGTLDLSEAAMIAAMEPLVFPVPGQGAIALAAGFAAFVLPFVAGGAPAVVIPPPAPFVPAFSIPPILPTTPAIIAASTIAAASTLALSVDVWAKTGLSGVPPAPPTIPWA